MKLKPKRFKYVRFLQYTLLAVVPLIALVVLLTIQSRGWANNILEQNMVASLDKNAALINQHFANLMVNINQLDSDPELHNLYKQADYSGGNILSIRREIRNICNRYFFDLQGMVSVSFFTKEHTFIYYDKLNMPQSNDRDFFIFKELENEEGKVHWYSTYNLATAKNMEYYAGSKLYEFDVFSIAKPLTMTYYRYDVPYYFPNNGIRPVLCINFSPQYFASMLSTDSSIADTNYVVYDETGKTVYASAKNLPFSSQDLIDLSRAPNQVVAKDKKPYLIYQKPLSNGCGWSVAAISPLESAYAYFEDGLLYTALGVLLITVIYCVIMVSLSMRSISKPSTILIKAIEKTAKGDFSYQITTQEYPDFSDVFDSYNTMNTQINQLVHENYEIKLNEKNLEIQVINLQFNPHFLYNTLNLISLASLSRGHNDISNMICALSDMMRYSLKGPQGLVVLVEDMMYIQNYIKLMQLRHRPPFIYEEKIEEGIFNCLVPKFMLQPFIENAIIHGFDENDRQFSLEISGKTINDQEICFEIRDNGLGMSKESLEEIWIKESDSLGIKNTHDRIQLYFGKEYGLQIQSVLGKGTVVKIVLPKKK